MDLYLANNTLYICSYFNYAALDFDPGPGTYTLSPEISKTAFAATYDMNGNFLSAFKINSYSMAHGISADNAGNIYLTGEFAGLNVDFDPGAPNVPLTSQMNGSFYTWEYEKEKLNSSISQRARVLLENYGNETRKVKKLVMNNLDEFEVIDLEKIIRLRAESNYTHFILTDKRKVTISRTLGEYEKLLDEHGFYRIHQSHIVNLRHVTGYVKADRGQVKMCDGELLQISRERKDGFILRFV